MERIGMSQAERDRLEWLKRARDGLVTQRQAAEKMGVTDPHRPFRSSTDSVKGERFVVNGINDSATVMFALASVQQNYDLGRDVGRTVKLATV